MVVVSSFGIPDGGDEDLNVRLVLLYIFLFLEDVEDAGMELDNAESSFVAAVAEADARVLVPLVALGLVDWLDNAAGVSSVAGVAEAEADARVLVPLVVLGLIG